MLKDGKIQDLKLDESKKTEFGYPAKHIDKTQLKEFVLPQQLRDEVPTLNRTGYMKLDLDEYSTDFIQYSSKSKDIVLEIGCAYGLVVQKVLENGGKIIAADASAEHLSVVIQKTPEAYLDNLFVYEGMFPSSIDFPDNSIGAVLISRVMHFLTGKEVEDGLNKINKWLVDGGKLYFTAVTPHHDSFREQFLPVYKKLEQEGNPWPGVIENQWELNPSHKDFVGPYLHVFDLQLLESLLPKHGFKIEKISLFDYPNDVDSHGKGHVGFIASKVSPIK